MTPTKFPRPRTALALIAALAAVAAMGSGCSKDASTRASTSGGPTTTAAPVTEPATIPPGTTLRVGDQLDYLKTVLQLAGEDQKFPYTVEYSSFIGGPAMLQAFQAGSLDTGFVGSTPLIFAQAAGQDLTAVAGWASENGAYGLVAGPGKDIADWSDVKGKRVAYQKGTASEAVLLQALDGVGLGLDDVETVDLPTTQVGAALTGGSADAGILVEPLTSRLIEEAPGAKVVARAKEITDRSSFLIASAPTLQDDATSAALADYIGRLVRAFTYVDAHPDQVAESVYVKQYGLAPATARRIVDEGGTLSFLELPGEVTKQQQKLADLFVAAGQIPAKVDVRSEFDTRFNDLVQRAQRGAG